MSDDDVWCGGGGERRGRGFRGIDIDVREMWGGVGKWFLREEDCSAASVTYILNSSNIAATIWLPCPTIPDQY